MPLSKMPAGPPRPLTSFRDAQRRRLMLAISLLVLGLTSYMTAVSIAALVHGQVRDAFAPAPPPVP